MAVRTGVSDSFMFLVPYKTDILISDGVDAGPTGYPAREREDLVQLGFFP